MTPQQARARFAAARVARLATVGAGGRPHLVPITFAVLAAANVRPDTIAFAVDHKPKRTTALKRLANIAANPHVSVLVDAYTEDWSALWWARADGRATVYEANDGRAADAVDALTARYPQYAEHPPEGPVVFIAVTRWSGWSATPQAPRT